MDVLRPKNRAKEQAENLYNFGRRWRLKRRKKYTEERILFIIKQTGQSGHDQVYNDPGLHLIASRVIIYTPLAGCAIKGKNIKTGRISGKYILLAV